MNKKWIIKVFVLTFILAIFFSLVTNILGNLNNIVLIICIIFVILFGVIFDIIGTATLSASVKVLHSKASQKIKGAKEAINLVNNASSVSSFCNDVVGDACGIISGSLITILIASLVTSDSITLWNIIITSLLSSLTVGGKAIGKSFAIKNANDIVFKVGTIIAIFQNKK